MTARTETAAEVAPPVTGISVGLEPGIDVMPPVGMPPVGMTVEVSTGWVNSQS
jgi:hypothetical protein